MPTQVSAATVAEFLGKVFAQAPAAAAEAQAAGDKQAAGGDAEQGGSACGGTGAGKAGRARSGYAVLSVQQLCAELDARPEVLETLLTYLEVGVY